MSACGRAEAQSRHVTPSSKFPECNWEADPVFTKQMHFSIT